MKPVLLFLSLTFLFLSCAKNNDAPENEAPTGNGDSTIKALKAYMWLFDSLVRIENGVATGSIIQSDPKVEMWYTNSNLYFNFPDGPQSEYNYEVVDGTKLYRCVKVIPKMNISLYNN